MWIWKSMMALNAETEKWWWWLWTSNRLFPVNDFNLFIYKKKVSTYFEQISWLNFYFYSEGNYLQLFCQKNLLQNFKLTIKNDFYLLLLEKELNFTTWYTKVFQFDFIFKGIKFCNFIYENIFNPILLRK